jgi:hypothetical protein
LCGAVRIEIAAAPYRVGICHCLDCRKRQAAIFSSFAVFPAEAVKVSGDTREFDRFGDEVELQIGCLDEPNRLVPTYESWMVRREAWLPPLDLANHYERDRLTKGRSDP